MGLDLNDDPALIQEYKNYHKPGNVWKEVIQSLHDSGINEMEIFLSGYHLFMIIEVDSNFSLQKKSSMDMDNPKVQEWERLMQSKFQRALPWTNELKWMEMERVFNLEDHVI